MGFEIPVDVDYFEHPKTVKLIAILGRQEADCYPLRLWRWATLYHQDGILPEDPRQIELALKWRGKPGRLCAALVEAGFIDSGPALDGGSVVTRSAPTPPPEPVRGHKGTFTLHGWKERIGRAIAIYNEKKRKQREKYGKAHGILPEESENKHPYSGGETQDGTRNPGGEGIATPTATPSAPPGTGDVEAREVDRTVGAFGFCSIPGIRAKAMAIADLRRQGISHEFIRSIAAKQEQKDFYEIIRTIQKGKASPDFKASAPSPKRCPRCDNRREVPDQERTTPERTVFKPCPECGTKATG